jgi:D-alanine-D-alanine ligase
MASPKVLVVYNKPVLPPDHPDYASEFEIVETSESIEGYVRAAGYDTRRFGYDRDPQALLDELAARPVDVVFNLFEGVADQTETEIAHASLLEWLGVPFTGAPASALATGRDKIRTKLMLRGAGLPTAEFEVIEAPPAPAWPHPWPAIVKPAYQDGSVGIDQGAVVESQAALADRVQWVFDRFGGPVLVERFLYGREFHVNMYEPPGTTEIRIIPPAEICFRPEPGESLWPIYSYAAKWDEESPEYKAAPIETGLELPEPLKTRVAEVCTGAYRMVGLRDYGRVDVRVTADGTPHVIEVNPNPYLDSIVIVDGLKVMDQTYGDFIGGLVASALGRKRV